MFQGYWETLSESKDKLETEYEKLRERERVKETERIEIKARK